MKRLVLILAGPFVFALSTLASAAQLVVIASSTNNYKPGTVIDGNTTIKLSADDAITLVAADGGTIKLTGPYQGKPDVTDTQQDPSLLKALSKIVTSDARSGASLAVWRSLSKQRGVWNINTAHPGTHCVLSKQPVSLWRRSAQATAQVVLVGKQGTPNKASFVWPTGRHEFAWPEGIGVVNNGEYRLLLDEDKPLALRLKLVPTELKTDLHRAAWMADNDCLRQAREIIRAVGQPG